VDVNSQDNWGQTALSWASQYGRHEVVVHLLLTRGDINTNSEDSDGWTALSRTSGYGHHKIVRLLLARDDVDVISKDNDFGWTALLWASRYGYNEIVRLLLPRDDIDISIKDNTGRTALSLVSEGRHESIIKMLEEKNQPGIDVGLENDDDAPIITKVYDKPANALEETSKSKGKDPGVNMC
ncbi:ankyrin repeat-containing domain protein, partial [Pyronema domesticum]